MACEDCAARERQIGRLEGILELQQGAFREIGGIVGRLESALIAKICAILARHGVVVERKQKPLQ